MGGGGGGGGSDAVDYQRQQEDARQARIRQGMTQIDEMFNGKDVITGYTGNINPNKNGIGNGTYYGPDGRVYNLQNGNQGNLRWTGTGAPGIAPSAARVQYDTGGRNWVNMPDQVYTTADRSGAALNPNTAGIGNGTFYGPDGQVYTVKNGDASNKYYGNVKWINTPSPGTSPQAANPHVQTNVNGAWENLPDQLYTGTTTEHQGGYDDAYYNKRATAYNDFALPQLQDQYKTQQKALTYALARGGNLGSSLASQKSGELDKDYALQQQAVYDTGQDYANKARSDVATNKQNLVQLLQASADPDAVANIAQSQAATMSQMPNFSPLSPVISNVASGLGTYLANQQTADAIKKAYSDPYSNPINRSSGKVG